MEENLKKSRDYGRAYSQFTKLMDDGRISQAYELLKARPQIISMLAPCQVEIYYEKMMGADLGVAGYFKELALERFSLTKQVFADIDQSARINPTSELEKEVMDIDEAHRKMLKEMARNANVSGGNGLLDMADYELEETLDPDYLDIFGDEDTNDTRPFYIDPDSDSVEFDGFED